MSRLCADCGIAPWEPCQCVRAAELDDNGLDPTVNPYQAAEPRRRNPNHEEHRHMPDEGFDTYERDARPPGDLPCATHVVIPLTITEPSAAAGVATSEALAAEVSALVDQRPNVTWPTSGPHAAHIMAVNLVTALDRMTFGERLVFFANLPDGDRDRLRALLAPRPQG